MARLCCQPERQWYVSADAARAGSRRAGRPGLTNREIATRLFISERTAESHVEQIRGKLGFHTRAQIAAWVTAQGAEGARPGDGIDVTAHPGQTRSVRVSGRSRGRVLVGSSGVAVTALAVLVAVVVANGWLTPAAPTTITTVVGTGEPTFSADGGLANITAVVRPLAVAIGPNGVMYIAEGNRVRTIGPDGRILTLAGTGDAGWSGDGGPAARAMLNSPQGLAVDSAGNVYIADTRNNRVRRVAVDGIISTVAGTGMAGYTGDAGSAGQAELNLPVGVAIGFGDNVLIADTGNHRVRKISADDSINTIVGTGEAGYRGDSGPALYAVLDAPTGLAFDGEGSLYIEDSLNERVRKVDVSGQIITVAGNGSAGFGGDGGLATEASLDLASNPLSGSGQGLAVDTQGNLYIADAQNHRVRRVDLRGKTNTIAGTGRAGAAGDGGPATQADLYTPLGLAVDGYGRVYIADAENNRVRRVA